MIITPALLGEKGACWEHQLEVFVKLFPNGVELTRENVVIAAENLLDLPWFVWEFCSDEAWFRFDQDTHGARKHFLWETWKARARYNQKTDDARDRYNQKTDDAYAWERYWQATTGPRRECLLACVDPFMRAVEEMGG